MCTATKTRHRIPCIFLFTSFESSHKKNKTGTSQVGAISKAQKAQNIFFGKKLETFEKKFSFGKCRTVPKKNRKGGPFSPVRACR